MNDIERYPELALPYAFAQQGISMLSGLLK
jgi:hypothetical protein